MTSYAAHPAGTLACGHQRRIEIMRALEKTPRLLLIDEPVAGMNDEGREAETSVPPSGTVH